MLLSENGEILRLRAYLGMRCSRCDEKLVRWNERNAQRLVASAHDQYLFGIGSGTIWFHRVEDDMSDFEVEIEEHENYTVLRPHGDIDAYSVGQFREGLSGLAEVRRLLIELSQVPFMDSAGLGALIGGIRRNRDHDGEIVVVCDKPALTRLLHTTGFDRIVPVTETLEEGVAVLLGDDAPESSD